jgi:flagellar protein FliJ
MTPFTFRLQRVLELREQVEQSRAQALGEARTEAIAAASAHAAVQSLQSAGSDALADAVRLGANVGTMHQLQFLLNQLAARESLARQGLVTAESLVRRAQDELRAAHADRRALDVLRDRQLASHRTAETAADRAQMDEIALTRFHASGATPTTEDSVTNG